MTENIDVVVIGAGQAGLAAGYYLKQTNLSFVLLDNSERIGNSWRERYDSLVLFNTRSFCALPDLNLSVIPTVFQRKTSLLTIWKPMLLIFPFQSAYI